MHPVLNRFFQRNAPRIVRLAEMKTILAQALHDQVYDEEVMFALFDQQILTMASVIHFLAAGMSFTYLATVTNKF